MMNDLGLGIVVSMKDAFSNNAARIQSSMLSLDQSVAAASERMTRNLDRIQKGTMMIGAGLTMLVLPAGLVASTVATQRSLAELSSLGVKDLKALEDAAEAFTNQWAGSTKADFLTAAYDVRSALAGLSDEAVGTFASMAALTGKATKATTAEMVGTFTTAYGIFKPIMADMSDISWAEAFSGGLAQTVAAFKTNGKEMADAIKNIGAVGAASNIPLQEQLAILGQLQTTMPGSEAGTLYKAFVMKAAEAGKELGLEFIDAGGRLKSVIPILEEVKRKFPDLSQAAAQVEIKKAFGSDEAVKFLLQMSQGMDALKDNIEGVGNAMKQGTALTLEMARAMNMDIGSQFTVVGQQVHNLAEILGATLVPVVVPVLGFIGRLVIAAQGLAKRVPGLTRALLLLSAMIGTVLVVVGGAVAMVGTVGIMLPAIKAGFVALSAGAASAGAAIATWFLPVVAVIAGVVLAVVLLRRAWESNFGGIRDFVVGAFDRVRMVFDGIRQLMASLSNGTGQMSAELAEKLQDAGLLGFVVTVFRVYYRVREYLTALWQVFSAAFAKVRAILEPAVRALLAAYGELSRAVMSVFDSFSSASGMADVSVFRTMGQVVGTLLGALATAGAYIARFLIFNLVLTIRVIAPVIRLLGWLGGVLISAFVNGTKAAMKFFLPLRMLIESLKHVGRVVAIVWRVLNGDMTIGEGIRAAGQSLMRFLATPFRWVRDVAEATWRSLTAGVAGLVGLFRRAGAAVLAAITALPIFGVVSSILGEIRALFSGERSFADAGRNILAALGRGLLAGATLPFRIVRGILRRVLGVFGAGAAEGGSLGRSLLGVLARGMLAVVGLPGRVLLRALGMLWEIGKAAVGKLSSLGSVLVGVLAYPFRLIAGIASPAWTGVVSLIGSAWQRIVALGAGAFDLLTAPFRWLAAVADAVWSGMLASASGFWQRLVGLAGSATAFLAAPFVWLAQIASGAWEGILSSASALFGALGGLVAGWWDRAKGIFSAVRSVADFLFGESAPQAAKPLATVAESSKPASPAASPAMTPQIAASAPPPSLPLAPMVPLQSVPGIALPPQVAPAPTPTPMMSTVREAEQAVIRMMATLVNVLQTAHEKIRSIASAAPARLPVPKPMPEAASRTPSALPAVVRTTLPVQAPMVPSRAAEAAVARPHVVPPVDRKAPPSIPVVTQARVAIPVDSKAAWGTGSSVRGDDAPALQDVAAKSAASMRRAQSAVRTTRGEWERIARNAGKVPVEDTALAALQSYKSVKARVRGAGRNIGTIGSDIGRTVDAPGETARRTAATAARRTIEGLPAAEVKPIPGVSIRLDRGGLGKALEGVIAPRRTTTPPAIPKADGVGAKHALLAASLAAGMIAAPVPFVPPADTERSAAGKEERIVETPPLDPTRTALLADTRRADASAFPAIPAPTVGGATGDPVPGLLQALIVKVDGLSDRPIDLTVTTKLDGREIAQAVYKDLRERKIRNYETL